MGWDGMGCNVMYVYTQNTPTALVPWPGLYEWPLAVACMRSKVLDKPLRSKKRSLEPQSPVATNYR